MITPMVLALLVLPIVLGTLALFARTDKTRDLIVITAAIAVAALGATVVVCGGSGWLLTVSPAFENVSVLLELAMIAAILVIAVKIRNIWIFLMAIAQIAMVAYCWTLPAEEHAELVLFRMDNLSRILVLVTCVVGAGILIFSIGYMKQHMHHITRPAANAGSLGRFYFFFIAFLGFMCGVVISDNLSFFSFCWEATTLCSYALIGQDGGEARRVNATRALLINSFGGMLLVLGVLLVKRNFGGESFTEILNSNKLALMPAVLFCVAAFTKSALFPFQSWLLGAMVAPTPVSAMLHSATMVKAGVYLVMRITPGFYSEQAMQFVAFAGALTFVAGALLACTQSNAKKVLAYSTISNLGLVVACAGLNTPLAYAAGLAIIIFHAISKGLLFLCVGNIEQKIGSRDIEVMDGMLYKMPFTTRIALLGMFSMLLPPFGMLLSKWLAIEATIRSPFLFIFMVLGSALTVFFWTKWIGRLQNTGYHENLPQESMNPSVKFSLGFLAFLVIATGIATMWIFLHIFSPMARKVFAGRGDLDWSTFNEAGSFLWPSVIIYAAVAVALVLYYFLFVRRFTRKNVRLPFLCGENVEISNVNIDDDVRSYDFHTIYDRVEHTAISSSYFRGYISEKTVTFCVNWVAWLVIIVLLGFSIASIR